MECNPTDDEDDEDDNASGEDDYIEQTVIYAAGTSVIDDISKYILVVDCVPNHTHNYNVCIVNYLWYTLYAESRKDTYH